MIIDLILDRKDGAIFRAWEFGNEIADYAEIFDFAKPIRDAIANENEEATKKALCEYVREQGYNEQICEYINSVNWVGTPSRKREGSSEKVGEDSVKNALFRLAAEAYKYTVGKSVQFKGRHAIYTITKSINGWWDMDIEYGAKCIQRSSDDLSRLIHKVASLEDIDY